MMKKSLIAFVLLFSLHHSFACDICGCSSGNYFIGPFPRFHKYFLGTRYTFRSFHSEVAGDPSQFSKDFYQTIEIWGGWNLGKRWQLLGFIPYNINRQSADDGISKSSGLGDITLIINYNLLNKQSGNNINQQLWVGGGIKVPTGKFSPDPNDVIPTANNQAGSGSLDYLLSAMYAIYVNKWGVNSSVNYKINEKADGYQFGDRLTSTVFAYRSLNSGKIVFNPTAGLIYENLQANKMNGAKVADTGGNALLGGAGLEVDFKKVSAGFNVQLPLAQNLSNEQTTAKVRGMVHLTFTL